MYNKIHLAISPCPNDTYIFYALLKSKIGLSPYKIKYTLADIQELNDFAIKGVPDVVKISVATYPYVKKDYQLLRSGGALGWGCGPVLVAKDAKVFSKARGARVAIPGRLTTAALLFSKYGLPSEELMELRYDLIMPAVANGQLDAGVVIHEGRMTYQSYNLDKIVDLGQWWEQRTGLPIPLGVIVARRNMAEGFSDWIEDKIKESLDFAHNSPQEAWQFIKENAQEIDEAIITKHIENFVTKYSFDMGQEGLQAINDLIERDW
ncbi:MAG TPA: 1,4-dihydroxy-6-naphthoate synthase [Desulfohalobiaceae bacterium]|nr:1,4-dihydroxy-6-naphthoate synthase [Desulfohalobiaceae bacterium]